MSSKTFPRKPIYPGFPWEMTFKIVAGTALFPEGATFKAEFRANTNSPVLATVTTENGGLERVDDNRIAVRLTGPQSKSFLTETVSFDLVRTDPPKHGHLGIRVQVPVKKSGTAPNE